ncbi:hypothetical protein AGABI1DRAFT_63655 [Agaricus bisporus var. burnettii JB137-S8]|uniref:Alpha-1,2-mannosidase n=1 Tax=Agaricus bisporus var. burnettii (strain JB137-S8 / ATCC MYA-4627 / FGSC 10392) TaxID=597362 RepID=K5WLA8_AGABU|nr:uncharacterized protein AGABI1DRAFT_63655 [Agaricus bisporus var. burnettii JB137-S8]EKM76066.1 hypothetical protein AGABI1DRAFT_63655 [Agaricus bisporus var. burnettii JB137-S8]
MITRTIVLGALLAVVSKAYIFQPDKTPFGRFLPFDQHRIPRSEAVDHVNLLIGNGGDTPNGSGGMIPSTGPPFAMTRWVAQTQENYVSATPYNVTKKTVHGFQATRQPAIWMGESGSIALVPGVAAEGNTANIKWEFDKRGLPFDDTFRVPGEEIISPAYYAIELSDEMGGHIRVEQASTSRAAHFRMRFELANANDHPYLYIDVARPSVTGSDPANLTQPMGYVEINPETREICGFSTERQDDIITPVSGRETASSFHGYFCARFDVNIGSHGIIKNGEVRDGANKAFGGPLGAYVLFARPKNQPISFTARVGTSFISIDQARMNLELEIPNPQPDLTNSHGMMLGTLEHTAAGVRQQWKDKLELFKIQGATDIQKEIFYTAVAHTFQYPSEQHEFKKYWSGYVGEVLPLVAGEQSYTGYSIWDTFRAAWAWQILFAPERLPGFVHSMLLDYKQSGWLPMWKNIVETNIMIGTHADSLIAEAVKKGVTGFDRELAWEAVWKDATVAPKDDATTQYDDRQENVDYEARAGLSSSYNVEGKGWVADDLHSESASRTLDYAYDDYAAYVLAKELGKPEAEFLLERSKRTPFTLWNEKTGFFEARNDDGSWAGEDRGWTEGDKWAYSFDVVHDIPQLIEKRGGNVGFVKSLEEHFNGGHNDHTNEPSHHIPYLYALSGAAWKTQERVREIAQNDYTNTPTGLSGNEDCGQMSAWYLFTSLGFYPVNPVSGEYVIGSPLLDRVDIELPPPPGEVHGKNLTIVSLGGSKLPYVKSVQVNGVYLEKPIITHEQIIEGGVIVFTMSGRIEEWGNDPQVLQALDANVGQLAAELADSEMAKKMEKGHDTAKKETVAHQKESQQNPLPDRNEL